jgi:hypothetical protein
MKIKKSFKLESACSKDATRPGIKQPFIQDGRAIATDGRIMASVKVETEEGEQIEEKKIPIEALKAGRKATLKLFTESQLSFTETHCSTLSGASFPIQHVDVRAPRVAEIVSGLLQKEEATLAVTIDATLLAKLAEALGSEKVTLCFKDAKSMISVHPSGTGDDAFGLLMPVCS